MDTFRMKPFFKPGIRHGIAIGFIASAALFGLTGAYYGATIALTALATQAANTAVANVTGSTAAPTAASLPSCVDSGGNHLNYTNGTGFSCGTTGSGASGALILISTQTATSSASLSWTGLGSTYNTLLLDCNDLVPASTNVEFNMVFGTGGTPTYQTSSYFYTNSYIASNGATPTAGAASESAAFINLDAVNMQTTAGQSESIKVWIHNVASTSSYKTVMGQTASWSNSHLYIQNVGGSWHSATTAITAIQVKYPSVNITSGQCSLYGLVP